MKDGMLCTEVKDTGVGIKKEDMTKLFQYFGKLVNKSEMNVTGMGLGLTISKMIVEKF